MKNYENPKLLILSVNSGDIMTFSPDDVIDPHEPAPDVWGDIINGK